MMILGNMTVIIIRQPEIEDYTQYEGKIEKCSVEIEVNRKQILNSPVDAENP